MSEKMLSASLIPVHVNVTGISYSANLLDENSSFAGTGVTRIGFAAANNPGKPVYKIHISIKAASEKESTALSIAALDDEGFASLHIALSPSKFENFKKEMLALPSGTQKLFIQLICEDALIPMSFGDTFYLPQVGERRVWQSLCRLGACELSAAKKNNARQEPFALVISFLAGALIALFLTP